MKLSALLCSGRSVLWLFVGHSFLACAKRWWEVRMTEPHHKWNFVLQANTASACAADFGVADLEKCGIKSRTPWRMMLLKLETRGNVKCEMSIIPEANRQRKSWKKLCKWTDTVVPFPTLIISHYPCHRLYGFFTVYAIRHVNLLHSATFLVIMRSTNRFCLIL